MVFKIYVEILLIVGLLLLGSTQEPECIPYAVSSLSDATSGLQCSTYIASCQYVTTPTNFSLSSTEDQLANILGQVQPNAELSQQCRDAFLFIYCLQTYSVCGTLVGGVYTSGGGAICEEDCIQAINATCEQSEWAFLTNLINQLRGNNIVMLPSLRQWQECGNNDITSQQSCVSLDQEQEDCTAFTTSTPPLSTTTSPSSIPSFLVEIVVGVCIGVTLVLVLVCILFFLLFAYCKRRKDRERQPDALHYGTAETRFGAENPVQKEDIGDANIRPGTLMLRASAVHEALLDVNLSPRTTTLSKRIKTSTFLNLSPKQRLQQLEYPRGNICLVRDLWETNFGPVYVGEASGLEQGDVLTSVFVKSLRNRASMKLRQQFQIEMTWASGFSHPNIISLLGVSMTEEPYYMLYEYLEYGSLKDFLQSASSMWFDFDRILDDTESLEEGGPNQSVFGVEDLIGMACQVADGMDYLAKKAFVLKDLAARNCHVGQNLIVKIANFGLSYDRSSEDYCCIRSSKNTPVPLRWLAPEAIKHNKVSVYSDIWSFGVLLWEIFSFGTRPYPELSDTAVAQTVLSGCVMPCPEKCPQGIYDIMLQCWNATPNKRPWFHTLGPELGRVPKEMDPAKRKSYGHAPTPEIARALRTKYGV